MSMMLRSHHKSHMSEAQATELAGVNADFEKAKKEYLEKAAKGESTQEDRNAFIKTREELRQKRADLIAKAHQDAKDKLYDPKAVAERRKAKMDRKDQRSGAAEKPAVVEKPEAKEEKKTADKKPQTELPLTEEPKAEEPVKTKKGKNGSSKKG